MIQSYNQDMKINQIDYRFNAMEQYKESFIVVSDLYVRSCILEKESGGLCLLRFPEGGGIRVKRSRVFFKREEAEASLNEKNKRFYKT